ncbi:MAG: flagellar hook-associated protein FlgK [Thermodesulfovibrionales bacterium]|nr:flagellar hook-associated protein FlgK [Thermodesulfovibrionales bacterium]
MYILGMLDIGKTALIANMRALNIVSHNIANINTPGFSRQEIILSTMPPALGRGGTIGRGVTVAGIRRSYEEYIQSQLLRQYQNYGRSLSLSETYSRIEQIFNEAKDFGLSKSLSDYFNAWHEVATNPEGSSQRVILLQSAHALVNTAKKIEQDLLENIKHINEELENLVYRINTIASNIASLNDKIAQIEVGNTGTALDYRDQRQNLLNQLSELIDYSMYEDNLGNVNIIVGMRNLVYGVKTNQLSLKLNDEGDKELFLDSMNITKSVEKGKVGGLLDVRDTVKNNLHIKFRRLIASLIKEVNIIHRRGFGLDGSNGNDFFTPFDLFTKDSSEGANITSAEITDYALLTLDEYDITFDSANNYFIRNRRTGSVVATGAFISGSAITFEGIRIVISGTVTEKDKFLISPLMRVIKNFNVAITDPNKVAASSNNTQLPGNNENALAIVKLSQSQISNLGSLTFANYYRGIVTETASLAAAAKDSFSFEENLLMEISKRRESISGVSLDEEAINLIKFQRAYEASAKMIKVTDELLQTILEL